MEVTDMEKQILELSAELYNLFCKLPDKHPCDVAEMSVDIHRIQQRVMARMAARSMPDFFNQGG